MELQIIPFRSSINTCYIIKDQGAVLIDGGWPGISRAFVKCLGHRGIKPEEIQLIILTHGDFDHLGGAKELQDLTGARIVIHEKDRENLEKGIFHWPEGVTGWGKISRALFKPVVKSMGVFPPAKAHMVLGDQGLSLDGYGIPGHILYTPGHTHGSVSVVLESGDAFVGCLAHNRVPFVLKPKLPIYAKDISLLKESWTRVIEQGAKTIYPGHGKPFPVEKIFPYLR
jgi:glyoxylase-like metal-dependent hydrolase (beta-lactamase superfamily II)